MGGVVVKSNAEVGIKESSVTGLQMDGFMGAKLVDDLAASIVKMSNTLPDGISLQRLADAIRDRIGASATALTVEQANNIQTAVVAAGTGKSNGDIGRG